MKPILTTAFTRQIQPSQELDTPMRIVVAYQDTATLVKAVRFCDRFVKEHWEDFEIECTWWKLGFLQHPDIFSASVEAATQADLILLSLPAESAPSAALEEWIERWIARRHFQPGALVSLTPAAGSELEDAPLDAYLQEVARRGSLDYFPHRAPARVSPPSLLEDEEEWSPRILDAPLAGEGMPRWGINE